MYNRREIHNLRTKSNNIVSNKRKKNTDYKKIDCNDNETHQKRSFLLRSIFSSIMIIGIAVSRMNTSESVQNVFSQITEHVGAWQNFNDIKESLWHLIQQVIS